MKLPIDYTAANPEVRKLARRVYASRQGGLCYFCHCPLNGPPPSSVTEKSINKSLFPRGFFRHPVHLHHDHKTGVTIGATHAYCNAVLWQYWRT